VMNIPILNVVGLKILYFLLRYFNMSDSGEDKSVYSRGKIGTIFPVKSGEAPWRRFFNISDSL